MGMTMNEVMNEIRGLSMSQGSWGRLYEELASIQKYDQDRWNEITKKIEAEKFDTTLDMVLYFEEGRHCHAKFWKIPVTWEAYGVIEVQGETAEEAIENFKKMQDDDDVRLPDDWDYVDGSFGLSDDNEEELLETIKIINKQ